MRALVGMAVGVALLAGAGATAAGPTTQAAGARQAVKETVVTGQHRGHTNDKLHLKLDDGKEMTFLVEIPGDKDRKWQKDYETLSRISVTYHQRADGTFVATALKSAGDTPK